MKKLLFVVVVSLAFLSVSTSAWAVPQLGVATDGPYFSDQETLESYQDDWTTDILSVGENQEEGFYIESGSTLNLWVTDNGSNANDNILTSNIYLFTDAAPGITSSSTDADPISDIYFDGLAVDTEYQIYWNTDVAAYKPNPYYGINLGTVADAGWDTLANVNSGADGYSGNTYVYTGLIEFAGILEGDDHFFLVADTGTPNDSKWNDALLEEYNVIYTPGDDAFSPMTTSGVGGNVVPEPTTMLLLGIGLVGLAGAGARKQRNRNKKS